MKKPENLANLIDPRFTSGYDELKQLVQFSTNLDETSLSATDKANVEILHIMFTAAVEGCNKIETTYELGALESAVFVWSAMGSAAALLSVQLMVDSKSKTREAFKREILLNFREGYEKSVKLMLDEAA